MLSDPISIAWLGSSPEYLPLSPYCPNPLLRDRVRTDTSRNCGWDVPNFNNNINIANFNDNINIPNLIIIIFRTL